MRKEDPLRLDQCFICKAWALVDRLKQIEVPDQGGAWIPKLACRRCLRKIMGWRSGGPPLQFVGVLFASEAGVFWKLQRTARRRPQTWADHLRAP